MSTATDPYVAGTTTPGVAPAPRRARRAPLHRAAIVGAAYLLAGAVVDLAAVWAGWDGPTWFVRVTDVAFGTTPIGALDTSRDVYPTIEILALIIGLVLVVTGVRRAVWTLYGLQALTGVVLLVRVLGGVDTETYAVAWLHGDPGGDVAPLVLELVGFALATAATAIVLVGIRWAPRRAPVDVVARQARIDAERRAQAEAQAQAAWSMPVPAVAPYAAYGPPSYPQPAYPPAYGPPSYSQPAYGQPGYPPAYGWPAPARARTNTTAALALVFGLIGGLLGIVLGHIALRQIKTTGEDGRGMALTGLIAGYAHLGLWVVLGLGALLTQSPGA